MYLAAVVATLAAYANSLANGFVFDDFFAVVGNSAVTGPFSLSRIFTTDIWGLNQHAGRYIGSFRPLMILSFAIDWRLGGGRPWVFHATNVLLHMIATAAFIRLLREHNLSRGVSLFAALLFAVHPIHTDAVTSVVGRSELLWFPFAVGMLISHRSDRPWSQLAAPLCLCLGLGSKESMLFVLPLLAWDDLSRRRWGRALPLRWGCYLAIVALVAWWRARLFQTAIGTGPGTVSNSFTTASVGERVVTGLAGVGRGVRLLFVPTNLQPDYNLGVTVPTTVPSVLTVVGLVTLLGLVAAVIRYRTRRPAVALAALWMAVPVVAGSNIPFVVTTAFAERFWYVPSAGFLLLLAEVLERGAPRFGPQLAQGLGALVVLLFGAATAARNLDWRDDLHLFVRAVEVSPNGVLGRLKLCQTLIGLGRPDLAVRHCSAALRLAPGWTPVLYSRGVALEIVGRYDEAGQDFDAMSRGTDLLPQMRTEYGHFLYEHRDHALAKRYLLEAMEAPGVSEPDRTLYLRAINTLQPPQRGVPVMLPMGSIER